MNKNKKNKYTELGLGIGIFVGACLGAIYGIFTKDDPGLSSAVGLCLGMGIGSCIGMAIDKNKKKA